MKSFLLILTLVALLTTGTTAHAQFYDKPSHLALGLHVANPLSTLSQNQQIGGGASAKLVMPLSEGSDLLLIGSGTVFTSKQVPVGQGKFKSSGYLNVLSAMIGYRYSFTPTDVLYDDVEANTFYIEPRIGMSFIRSKTKSLAYAPTVGYLIKGLWDISLSYHANSSSNYYDKVSYVGLSVAYNFSF